MAWPGPITTTTAAWTCSLLEARSAGRCWRCRKDVAKGIQDELFVSEGPGRYRDIVREVGIDKRGCSGRKVNWVDFNRDGLWTSSSTVRTEAMSMEVP